MKELKSDLEKIVAGSSSKDETSTTIGKVFGITVAGVFCCIKMYTYYINRNITRF